MDQNCDEEEIYQKPRGNYAEKYTQDGLREAIEKIINNEMSYGAASKIYNIPKATLHHKMRHPVNCPKGASTVLTKEQEDELADWILLHADFGDPRTKQDIVIAAAEISQLDSSNKFKNGIPSSGWMEGFLNRHPLCRERTPQSISKASAINTKDDFAGLWRNIYNYFEKIGQLGLLNNPELWWNADETCFEKDKIPKKVIARRGAKRVSRREMGPPKANTTVTYAFSAAGDYVEPLITLKDSNSSVAEIAFALGCKTNFRFLFSIVTEFRFDLQLSERTMVLIKPNLDGRRQNHFIIL